MRLLIQDAESQKYLARNGTWTPVARDGEDFRFSPKAYAIVRRKNARVIRAVFYFEDSDYLIAARTRQDHSQLVRAAISKV
jgi:hypothetical protein